LRGCFVSEQTYARRELGIDDGHSGYHVFPYMIRVKDLSNSHTLFNIMSKLCNRWRLV
jgi:hypothetical protein